MKVSLCPVFPDMRKIVSFLEGSHSSSACLSDKNSVRIKKSKKFTLLVPYIFNYIYVMQTNVHSVMLFNTIFIKCCPTCF
jgi:hypothetical protein